MTTENATATSDLSTLLAWLDLETTGFDPSEDRILECAVVITTGDLVEVARMSEVTLNARFAELWRLNPVVQAMHSANGLWMESLRGRHSTQALDRVVCAFLRAHVPIPMKVHLAGNSINFDEAFLRAHMPETFATLHHRQVNVSSLNELARRAWPSVYATRPRGAAHRALPDVLSSIEQCRHYFHGLVPATDRVLSGPTAPSVQARRGLEHLIGCARVGKVGDGVHDAVLWIADVLDQTRKRPHDLYETGDRDAPDQIKDGNGEVALGCCRRCGEGEGTLAASCPGARS